jgi:CheY-like chemotaxis protein
MAKKILIVDDTRSWQIFHKDLIHQLYGDMFEIHFASSATEGYQIVMKNADEPFDVILTDLQMEFDYEPKLAGEWFVENIKNIHSYSSTHIVIISGMYNVEHIAKQLNVECISKSILVRNHNLMKFMFEKLMPYLTMI